MDKTGRKNTARRRPLLRSHRAARRKRKMLIKRLQQSTAENWHVWE